MSGFFKDREHMVRMLLLFVAGVLLFVVVRAALVPEGFGAYGFYRPGSLADNAAREPVHAGRAACTSCHEDVVAARAGSRHEAIGCETCHGPLALHAADPSAQRALTPSGRDHCLICHAREAARPVFVPQVEPLEHGDGEACTACHLPHAPAIGGE